VLEGEVPNPAAPPPGCSFNPRCFRATELCRASDPALGPYGETPTRVACHHAGPLAEGAPSSGARGQTEVAL